MKFAIDFGDTITQHPEILETLCSALVKCGHEVHIVTAVSPGATVPAMKARIAQEGFKSYTHIKLCASASLMERAQMKADYIAEQGISFLIDDCIQFCEAVKRLDLTQNLTNGFKEL